MDNNIVEEIWKDVDEYEGLYMVSNKGRVWSHTSNRTLKRYRNSKGYEHVNLSKNGRTKHHPTHRLVAHAFVENKHDLPYVNHKDEDIRNNSSENLEWCTHHYNCHYGTRIERITQSIDYNEVAKKNSKSVAQYSLEGQLIKVWESAKECNRRTGYSNSAIAKCCKKKSKTAYGYIWRYENEGIS